MSSSPRTHDFARQTFIKADWDRWADEDEEAEAGGFDMSNFGGAQRRLRRHARHGRHGAAWAAWAAWAASPRWHGHGKAPRNDEDLEAAARMDGAMDGADSDDDFDSGDEDMPELEADAPANADAATPPTPPAAEE